ncbi:MAG: SDR family oxidoreductase [Phycisphaerae bacterium]|nr:SDR family oxidoreductase [Phycisphaerae bacterium]
MHDPIDPSQRWLVTGSTGQLGGHLVRQLLNTPVAPRIFAWTGRKPAARIDGVECSHVDLADSAAIGAAIDAARPTHILHVAAMTAVGDAFANPDLARRINVEATARIMEAARAGGARVAFSSTDMVFSGDAAPYREADATRPLSVYGRTKALAEEAVVAGGGLVLRIPLLYGVAADGRPTTFSNQLAALRRGGELKLFTDEYRTPLWVEDAARIMIALASSTMTGVRHVAGPQRLSRAELVAAAAQAIGATHATLLPISRLDIPAAEPRPADLSLDDALLRRERPDLVCTTFSLAARSFAANAD